MRDYSIQLRERRLINFNLHINDEAFRYLVVQRGSISNLSSNRVRWEAAYREGLEGSYRAMQPYLPETCRSILDVGGGLGGIDIYLSRHYGNKPLVTIIDGASDLSVVEKHAKTFSNREVAHSFHRDNGIENLDYLAPSGLVHRSVDLVVSTAAWCFHFPPENYLGFVRTCLTDMATLILDVRRDKPEWLDTLCRHFTQRAVIAEGDKKRRIVFDAFNKSDQYRGGRLVGFPDRT